ncbi:MAG: M20 family metallopeptidase [Chloroflexi bacterium]|nr:M20 family metallopeptidase [Chloroflexota bacterium]
MDLLSFIQAQETEIVLFLQDLVRLRSVNGVDTETAVAQRILTEAKRLNLPAQLVAADPKRPNVVVKWGTGKTGFVLIGHMDTVAEGDHANWSHPPFGAVVENGRLYGRGAADNKAGIACALYTLAALRDLGLLDPTQFHVTLAGVVDEESGASSLLGVRHLLDEGFLAVQGAIYTYTSDIICVGHRGLLRLQLHARGQSTHTGSGDWSRGEVGVNAVTGLAAVLLCLEELDLPAPSHPAFQQLGCKITPGTLFRGGEFESVVPAAATALVDIRLMPGQKVDGVLTAVQQTIDNITALRPGLSIASTIKNNLPGVAIPMDHPLVQIAQRQTKTFTGQAWPIAGAGPANEGYMLIQADIPTLCGFGPSGDNAHAPDEWVDIASLSTTIGMYVNIIRDYLQRKK